MWEEEDEGEGEEEEEQEKEEKEGIDCISQGSWRSSLTVYWFVF